MGMFNDYVEKKRWVGGPKMYIFVRVKNVYAVVDRWSKRST